MRFHIHSSEPGPPCGFMERFLQARADGTAGPFARWYALAHALRCTRCRKYLQAMEALLARLRREREVAPPTDVHARLSSVASLAAAQINS